MGSLDAGGKVDTREGFTDVERGPVAVGVPVIVFGELGVPGVLSREHERASSARPIQMKASGSHPTLSLGCGCRPRALERRRF
jgi:hypothetical protein